MRRTRKVEKGVGTKKNATSMGGVDKETKQVVAANRLVEKMQAEAYVQLLLDTKQKHRDTELI